MVVIDRSALASSMAEAAGQILGVVKKAQADRKQMGDRISGEIDNAAHAKMIASGEMLVLQAQIRAHQIARTMSSIGMALTVADFVVNGNKVSKEAGGGFKGWMAANKSLVDSLTKQMTTIGSNEAELQKKIAAMAKIMRKLMNAGGTLSALQG